MSAGVPAGPLESDPGGFLPGEERSAVLAGVLDGVELGAWDRRVARWLTELDTSALVTIASWIARSRAAGGVPVNEIMVQVSISCLLLDIICSSFMSCLGTAARVPRSTLSTSTLLPGCSKPGWARLRRPGC